MKGSELFLKLYNELEYSIKKKYGYSDSPVFKASENELKKYKEELDTLRSFRNLLAHSRPFGTEYCAEPHKNLINTLKKIIIDIDDELLINKCTKINKLVYANINDNVLSFMNKMQKHIYSHIPVLENNKVIGVFSESKLFNYFVHFTNHENVKIINEKTTFSDIKELISLNRASKEEYSFMSKYTNIDDAIQKFKEAYTLRNKRIGMIFITENGNKNEDLIGIITAWDILGKDELFYI